MGLRVRLALRMCARSTHSHMVDFNTQIWGSPYSRGSGPNTAFQSEPARRLNAVPAGVDLLLTHGPLHTVGTLMVTGFRLEVSGLTSLHSFVRLFECTCLWIRIQSDLERMRPRVHVCGHIHARYI